MVKASNNAARGISRPEVVYMDELSEMKDLDGFASLRYTMMASRNPQVWTFRRPVIRLRLSLISYENAAWQQLSEALTRFAIWNGRDTPTIFMTSEIGWQVIQL